MANKNIFCNTPWYELHIYWDGSLGICCQETHKLYQTTDKQYNIASMTIQEWFNSDPVKKFRTSMLGDQRLSVCRRCYYEEDNNGVSRRVRSNQKSVIFTRTAFDESFKQSPGHQHFINPTGHTDTHPIDLHIDLGNYCNLACKMCYASASSVIAAQQVKWGITDSQRFIGTDWTRDESVWQRFKQELLDLPNLKNIHFMGGETLLTNRFEDLVDTMIEHKRFNLCFSFVTNGTVFKPKLLDKLSNFQRVGIEVSIETVDAHNAYQRQGTDTDLVLDNIERYQKYCNGTSITLTLRPVPSILSIGYYPGLLQYALEKQLVMRGSLCYEPQYLSAEILPTAIKNLYKTKYLKLLDQLSDISTATDYNASDPNNYKMIVKEQVEACLSLLDSPTPEDSEQQLERMVRHCEKWDRVYNYNAWQLYPEFHEILKKYDYQVSN